jgi:hypothetical protein
MNKSFLIRPTQLNQAFESNSSSGGSDDGNGVTRRTFIKRTGGTTVATLVAWNIQNTKARANFENDWLPFSVLGTVEFS